MAVALRVDRGVTLNDDVCDRSSSSKPSRRRRRCQVRNIRIGNRRASNKRSGAAAKTKVAKRSKPRIYQVANCYATVKRVALLTQIGHQGFTNASAKVTGAVTWDVVSHSCLSSSTDVAIATSCTGFVPSISIWNSNARYPLGSLNGLRSATVCVCLSEPSAYKRNVTG